MANDESYYFLFDITEYIVLIILSACLAQFSYYVYIYKRNLIKKKDSRDIIAEVTFLFVVMALSTKIILRLVALIGAESSGQNLLKYLMSA